MPSEVSALTTVLTAAAADAPSWADAWQAWGSVVAAGAAVLTLCVALAAAVFAKKQVQEAQATRREQAQPYVVVYAEPHHRSRHAVEIVIRNFGSTGASDVHISCAPELRRSDPDRNGFEKVELPWTIPFLAPGQEWRTLWDSPMDRREADLPDRYDLTVTYTDSHGTKHPTPSVLDWGLFRQRMYLVDLDVHDAAGALKEINKTLGRWSQSRDTLRVATYDGEQYDRRLAEERDELRRRRGLTARLLPTNGGETEQ